MKPSAFVIARRVLYRWLIPGPRRMSRKPLRSKSDDTFGRLTKPSAFSSKLIHRPSKENIGPCSIYLLIVRAIEAQTNQRIVWYVFHDTFDDRRPLHQRVRKQFFHLLSSSGYSRWNFNGIIARVQYKTSRSTLDGGGARRLLTTFELTKTAGNNHRELSSCAIY